MSYIPHEYWFKHGRTYKDEFRYNKNFELQEKILIDYLKDVSSSFSSVLEVGCGFGRITKLLLSHFPNITEYFAIDLSPDQIENFFFSSRRRHTRWPRDWSSDVCSSD